MVKQIINGETENIIVMIVEFQKIEVVKDANISHDGIDKQIAEQLQYEGRYGRLLHLKEPLIYIECGRRRYFPFKYVIAISERFERNKK